MSGEAALRVLIADDNADIRRLVRIKLELAGGFEVLPDAVDGVGAVQLADTHLPDVILLDLSMPVMDGLEALPLLRQVLPYGRIIMLSGFDSARFRVRALELGADEYVEKGGSLDALVGLIRELGTPSIPPRVPEPRQEVPATADEVEPAEASGAA
jgi:DNA-binding NarL/FixJ family response regulator